VLGCGKQVVAKSLGASSRAAASMATRLGRCTVPPCDRRDVTRGLRGSLEIRDSSRMQPSSAVQLESSRGAGCTCSHNDDAGTAHLWAASTGLPGLRCASMPFADELIFNFGPGVAAGGFRALDVLVGVAVVDME
jgi:hypothetical protein